MPRTDLKKRPAFCPFCKRPIKRPREIPSIPMRQFPGGKCDCGTVFVSDVTGKNGGEALIESLSLACDNDLDKVWSLRDPEDYKVKIMSYNTHTHTFNKSGHFKDGMARLYFVRLSSIPRRDDD